MADNDSYTAVRPLFTTHHTVGTTRVDLMADAPAWAVTATVQVIANGGSATYADLSPDPAAWDTNTNPGYSRVLVDQPGEAIPVRDLHGKSEVPNLWAKADAASARVMVRWEAGLP